MEEDMKDLEIVERIQEKSSKGIPLDEREEAYLEGRKTETHKYEYRCPFQSAYFKLVNGYEECRCIIPLELEKSGSWLCDYLRREEDCPIMVLTDSIIE